MSKVDLTSAKPTIDLLFTNRDELLKEVRRINEAIAGLQAVCQHNMVDNGHDSHYNHEICTICRKEDNKC